MAFYVTPAADAFLQHLCDEAGQPLAFRVRVQPGASAGRRISVDLENSLPAEAGDDVILRARGYQLLLDAASMDYLSTYHMDYDSSGAQPAFTFHHVHAPE